MFELLDHLQKEWAVIEGAPISFAIVVVACFAIVSLLYRHRFALLKDEIADYKYALDAVAPAQLAKRIKIVTPPDGDRVGRQLLVTGVAKPAGSPVHVLLLAGDGRWHPQEKPRYNGTGWRARCWVGVEGAPSGTSFQIVAIDAAVPVLEPLAELPSGIARSKIVTVHRQ